MDIKPDQKGTLLTPGEEYKDYCEFCAAKNEEPDSEAEFYKSAYLLAIRRLVFKEGIGALTMGDLSLILCPIGNNEESLALAIFQTKELEKFEENQGTKTNPIEHLG